MQKKLWAWLLLGLLLLAACGGGETLVEETAVANSSPTASQPVSEADVADEPAEAAVTAVLEAEPEPTAEPAPEPTGPDITAELDIANLQRTEAEGVQLEVTDDCFERLFGNGRFVLFNDGSLTYTPSDPTALSDCLLLDATELSGEYEPSSEADYDYEIEDIDQFAGLENVEIDVDGTITGAEGTVRLRIFPASGEDRSLIQLIRADYVFNGATAVTETVPFEYTLSDALASSGAPTTVLPAPNNPFTAINDIRLEFVTNLTFEEVKTFYEQNFGGLGWTLDNQFENELYFVTDDSRDSGYIRPLEFGQTIVELSLVNNRAEDELMIVPLPSDALIGFLSYFQLYDLPTNYVSGYLDTINTRLVSDGWTLIDSQTTEAGQNNLWELEGQQINVQQVSNDRFENGVRLAYSYSESVIRVNLDDVRNGVVVGENGGETAVSTDSNLPSINPGDYTEQFTVVGSSNIVVVDELMVRFADAGYAGLPLLNLGNGTAAGIASLCLGDADGALATRTMTEDEAALCTSSGEQVLNFVLARNPIVVIVNPANDWAKEMSADELALALTTAEAWSDINNSWPDLPIERIFPGTDSFPYSQVNSFLFPEDADALVNAIDAQFSEDDNVLVSGVANSEGAISFIAHSGFVAAQGVTAVSIAGLAPGSEGYLFDQPIILLTLDRVLQANPDMAAFINFSLTDGRLALFDIGLALPDEATQQANEQAWLDAVGE